MKMECKFFCKKMVKDAFTGRQSLYRLPYVNQLFLNVIYHLGNTSMTMWAREVT